MLDASSSLTSDPEEARRYHCAGASDFAWAEWDGDYVLFHRPSGKTHFLNATAVYLIFEVLEQPCTAAEATESLLASQAERIEEVQHVYVSDLLRRFAELGIISS